MKTYNSLQLEEHLQSPRPALRIYPNGNEDYEFKMIAPGVWGTYLRTEKLASGHHDLIFQVAEASVHASDQPLLVLDPKDYRKELIQEAKERFLPSVGIWHSEQLANLMRATIDRKFRYQGLDHFAGVGQYRAEGLGKLPKLIATSPIYWVLDALVDEFLYLTTMESEVRYDGWNFSMEEDILRLSCHIEYHGILNREVRAAVANRELSDLHLLGVGGDLGKFMAKTEFEDEDIDSSAQQTTAHISVQFSMYEGAMQEVLR